MAKKRTRAAKSATFMWPKRALAFFILILLIIAGLIFFTGPKSAAPKLGIDLQGGTRVTLVPQGDSPTQDQLQQARQILENRVNGMGVSGAEVRIDGSNLVITVPGEDAGQARALGQTSQLLFRAVDQPAPPTNNYPKVVQNLANRWVDAGIITKKFAQERLDQLRPALEQLGMEGLPEKFTVSATEPQATKTQSEEQERLDRQVEVLRKDRQSNDADLQQAAATFLDCEAGHDPMAGSDDPAKPLVTCSNEGPLILMPAPVLEGEKDQENGRRLTGDLIDTNSPITGGYDAHQAQMAISFRFKTGSDNPGGETWSKLGQEMLNRQVAITLDSQVISAPTIVTPTPPGETSQITGDFSEKEATELANNLRYGALPLSFVGENGESGGTATSISPSLGEASLRAGIIAGVIGLALVALWALVYYRGLGVVALASLVASFLLVYGMIVLLGRWIGYSLDLAGIAGLIIGIGTTADSFVIYFERIKDEIKNGSTFRSAVPRAWDRAKTTIITGNIVSLIAAVILYFLAIGDVKGFAFTLGLTTLFDVLTAFLVTAPLLILLSRRPAFANPKLNGLGTAFRYAERHRLDEDSAESAKPTAPDVSGDSGTADDGSHAAQEPAQVPAQDQTQPEKEDGR